MKNLIDKLLNDGFLSKDEFVYLIENRNEETAVYLAQKADEVRKSFYKKDVYIRGLIEISNYCKNDCFYCGIRNSNKNVCRYRLTKDEILSCADVGYKLGFRTFVLQGGEDEEISDRELCDIIFKIKKNHPDCAVTLSLGEKSFESYKMLFDSGADRYLLRHETANESHYKKLHPVSLSLENRKRCLYDLKEIGYQVGTGFMVGSPFQTAENLAEDMLFLKELKPEMVGIGPFIPHKDTPFGAYDAGTLELTLFMLGLIRLMLPKALIPATTALATLSPIGRELALKTGANVIMPNLSPTEIRKHYSLYDGKAHTNEEAAEGLNRLKAQVKNAGYEIVAHRGDHIERR